MAIRTITDIINSAVTFIQDKLPSLTMLTGTVARDVVVEAPAQEFSLVWTELSRVQRQQLYNDSTAYTNDELTKLASSFGIQRLVGVAATGTMIFRLKSFTVTDDDIVIPIGTEISTASSLSNNNTVAFTTTAERIFAAAAADTYYNPSTNLFEIVVPIQASQIGVVGNVGAGTINNLISSVPGAPTVVNNIATSGGAEQETSAALLGRILTKFAGTSVGTVNGLLSIVNANANVVDSLAVVSGDAELVRDEFGNAADVVIIGETLTPIVDVRTFTAGVTDYVLNRQPVGSNADAVEDIIAGTASGLSFNFIKGIHFKVVVDNNSLTVGSTRALTKIVFLGSPFPDTGSSFTAKYAVNGLVEDLQSILDSDDTKIIGTDILVREAVKILIRTGAFIKVLPGYTKGDVVVAAQDNITALLNSITLDTNVDQSDIIATIQNTPGVDSVTVPIALEIKRPVDTSFASVSNINIARTEYGRPDTSVGAISIT